MRRNCGIKNCGAGILIFAVFVTTILGIQPCFSECEFAWRPGEELPGFNGDVHAFTVYNGQLIAGGAFTTASGASANRIAVWDGNSWQPLGSGMNSTVEALAVYDGQLIAGGRFSSTGGGADVNYIATWDGNSWQSLGGGMSVSGSPAPACVLSLAVYNGKLIAGGRFTEAGGVDANSIAAWDGNSWQPLGGGIGGIDIGYLFVHGLTIYNGELIAGGSFFTAGDVDAIRIAAWNGSNWRALGSGVDDRIWDLTVYDGELIAGGAFYEAGGISADYIAAWDGNSWQSLGSGMSDWVYALTVYNGELIAGGSFTTAGGTSASRITSWNGSSWQALGSGIYGVVYALTVYNGDLTAGGLITTAGGYASSHWARWGVPEVYKGDLNHDCGVDYSDLGLFVARWLDGDCLQTSWCCEADLDYDGGVDFSDYAELAANWLEGD